MNDKIPLQIPAYMQKFSSLSNGGVKFEFVTQENIAPELLTNFFALKDKLGYLLFAVRMIDAVDMMDLPKIDTSKYEKGKTPSNRLRSVFYLIHEKTGGTKENFNAFYEQKMEMLIEHFKEKLSEL